MTLSWKAPTTGGGSISDYLVEYRPRGATYWVCFPDPVSPGLSARVTGLADGTLYEFRVAAQNSVGTGPWSSVLTRRPGVPTRPGEATATAGPRRVTLAWAAPPSTGGAPIVDYLIRYRPLGSTDWVRLHDGVSIALRAQVPDLHGGLTYEFQVAARNSRGTGLWSHTLQATPRA